MHEYDIALKSLLRRSHETLLALTNVPVETWHNVELPEVRTRRADLLGETVDGRILHIELQSTNDFTMALRMMEYCAAIYRQFGRFPEQTVLYVGEPRLRMKAALQGRHFSYECRIVDIREVDGERLLDSERLEDNVIAVLARLRDNRAAIRQILSRIAAADPAERANALTGVMILAGLRRLSEVVEREAHVMPILNDILDHPVLGREFKRGLAQGIEEGREQGLEKGRHDGELNVLLRMIEKRFGSVPVALRERLAGMSGSELETIALRLLDARNLADLLN